MIQGICIAPRTIIKDQRGQIIHMIRNDDPEFTGFGEIYFSTVRYNVIKGWHLHKKMTLRYAVVSGIIKLVLYDDRSDSATRGKIMEIIVSRKNYKLIIIPPNIWNAFQGLSKQPAIVANCADLTHDPEEIIRIDPRNPRIPYHW